MDTTEDHQERVNITTKSVISLIKTIQNAFRIISLLQYTAYKWPSHTEVNDGESFDYIIVGAGTAGCVIANRLSERLNMNILLIEAGGDPPLESDLPRALLFLQRSNYDWNFTAETDDVYEQCHQYPYLQVTQGKFLGGSSSLDYLQYDRGYRVDYDTWATLAENYSWRWENVLPYFKKSERCEIPEILDSIDSIYHGKDGYLGVTRENYTAVIEYLKCFKSLGLDIVNDYNPEHPLGFSRFLTTISNGERQSSANAFLSPIKHRNNLFVMKDTMVHKIIFENNKATGVIAVTDKGNKIFIKARREVIVSAGTFNSAKLLILSGIGPRTHLENLGIPVISDLPVGENLQDHIGVLVLHLLKRLDTAQYQINPYRYPSNSFRGFIALNRKQEYPDYSSHHFIVEDYNFYLLCAFTYRFKYDICDTMLKTRKGKIAIFNQIINLAPKSRGKVMLRSTNPLDSPVIYTGQFSDPEDLENLVKYVQDINTVLDTPFYQVTGGELLNLKPSICSEFLRQTPEYLRCYVKCISYSLQHFTGTCSLGKVVDGNLKVRGVEGLRVADASVIPSIPRASPGASVIMIGEKAADFIKEEETK